MYRTGIFFGVAKISNIILGMPDIPDIWGVGQTADAGSNPTYLDSRCGLQVFLRSLRCVSRRKKKWRKLDTPAGKCTHTKPKVGVKIHLIWRFREL